MSTMVLKIGGSLITYKEDYCAPNLSYIDAVGHELAAVIASAEEKLLIVLGGGSFGNGVPKRFDLLTTDKSHLHQIGVMTESMFSLLAIVSGRWRAAGLPVHPLQASGFIRIDSDGQVVGQTEIIHNLMDHGLIPMTSGDLLFGPGNVRRIVSSDDIPESLAAGLAFKRVAMMTDVPGVIDGSKSSLSVVRVVKPSMRGSVLAMAAGSAKPDVTGGMRTKVGAMIRLAEMGIEGLIADGRVPGNIGNALTARRPRGTFFVA